MALISSCKPAIAQGSKELIRAGGREKRGALSSSSSSSLGNGWRSASSDQNPQLHASFLCQQLQKLVALFRSLSSSHCQLLQKNIHNIASKEEDATASDANSSGADFDQKVPANEASNPNDYSSNYPDIATDSSTLNKDPNSIRAGEPIGLQMLSVGPRRPRLDKGRKPPIN